MGALIKMSCAPPQVVIFGPKNVYTSMISFVHSVRPDFFFLKSYLRVDDQFSKKNLGPWGHSFKRYVFHLFRKLLNMCIPPSSIFYMEST